MRRLLEQAKVDALRMLDCIFRPCHCGAHRALLQNVGPMGAE
jgi:hypothetical protein